MSQNSISRYFSRDYILLWTAIIFSFIVRYRLIDIPIERDEGEFAYIARLILDGISPFEAYNYKLPGVSAMYALSMLLFGDSFFGFRFGLILITSINIYWVYKLTKNLFSKQTAALAALFYSFLSLDSGVLGNSAHATHYVMFFILPSIIFLLYYFKSLKTKYIFISGLSAGMAFLMKQPAAYFYPFLGLLFILYSINLKSDKDASKFNLIKFIKTGTLFALSVTIPLLILILITIITGYWETAFQWTWKYPAAYTSVMTISEGMDIFKIMFPMVSKNSLLIWIMSAIGLLITSFTIKNIRILIFIWSFTIFSFLAVTPGYYFRNHYFILFLPVIALLAASLFESLNKLLEIKIKTKSISYYSTGLLLAFIGLWLITVSGKSDYLFTSSPKNLVNEIYRGNPFLESQYIANYIKKQTSKEDKIAILGSEAEILFYSERKSATGFLYTYEMVKPQAFNLEMQKLMISEIEASMPKYLLFINVSPSWAVHPKAPQDIFKWYEQFIKAHYILDGIVDVIPGKSVYKFGSQALKHRPTSKSNVFIFKLK